MDKALRMNGSISSKNWAKLSMNANGKGGKMKSKMAKFDAKGKDEGKETSIEFYSGLLAYSSLYASRYTEEHSKFGF